MLDLPDGLSSNAKLFADDTSLFSVVKDINTSVIELNSALKKINDSVIQWKMTFNPDRSKQVQETIFSRKWFSTIIMFPRLTFKHILELS